MLQVLVMLFVIILTKPLSDFSGVPFFRPLIRLEHIHKYFFKVLKMNIDTSTVAPSNELQAEAKNHFKNLLCSGKFFFYCTGHPNPNMKYVWVTSDLRTVHIANERQKDSDSPKFDISFGNKSIAVADIVNVAQGQTTTTFMQSGRANRHLYAFSLLTSSKTIDLEVIVTDINDRDEWVMGFKLLRGEQVPSDVFVDVYLHGLKTRQTKEKIESKVLAKAMEDEDHFKNAGVVKTNMKPLNVTYPVLASLAGFS